MAITRDKAVDRAQDLRPYVERALRDEELREHVVSAYESARKVYDHLTGGKNVTDKKVQKELRRTMDELREASDHLREPERSRGWGKLFLAVAVGALFANPVTGPAARNWVKEKVFGPEEP